jgi:hypothetical protein
VSFDDRFLRAMKIRVERMPDPVKPAPRWSVDDPFDASDFTLATAAETVESLARCASDWRAAADRWCLEARDLRRSRKMWRDLAIVFGMAWFGYWCWWVVSL